MMRGLLTAAISEGIGEEQDVALLFSGGTDSTCILLSCIYDLGIHPVLYTYHVRGIISQDLRRAREVADCYGLTLRAGVIEPEVERVFADVRQMLCDGVRGKVALQCMHGHYKLAPLVQEPVVLNGSGIDGIYGTYTSTAYSGARKDKAIFDAGRQKHLDNPNDDAMEYQRQLYQRHGTRTVFPYRHPLFIQRLMALNWVEINMPKYKAVIVREYPEYTSLPKGHFRPRGSQQIMAGTREIHDRLLRTPWNRRGRLRVNELYKDLAEEYAEATV